MLWQCSRTGPGALGKSPAAFDRPYIRSALRCSSVTYAQIAPSSRLVRPAPGRSWCDAGFDHELLRLERETGIEPATNSLEGCDSTTELLPPSYRSTRKIGGEGRIRTSEATWATDLQSVAFDRSATSPTSALRQCLAILSAGPRRACLGGRLLECSSSPFLSCVVPRSHIVEYAASSRLVSRAPDRSRCDAGFHHGQLELAKGFEPPTR